MVNIGHRRSVRWASIGVLALVAAIAIGGSLATHNATQSEEKHLLNERASEIGLILTGDFATLQTQLATVAAETKLNGANPKAFTDAANALIQSQPGSTTVLAQVGKSSGTIRYLAETAAVPPSTTGPRATLIQHALTIEPPAVTGAVFSTGSSRMLGLAYPVGVKNLVIYQESIVNPTASGSATAQGQPFRELNVALYVGTRQDAATLIITTGGGAPLTGTVATATSQFGADTWLVAIKATTPLIGSFAANAYWLVLGGGLVLAIALAALVEAVLRRRDYALTLVDERTAELSDSLAKLERAQEQLLRQERLAAIGELASAVGHELRNPLGVITNAHFLLRSQLQSLGNDSATRHLATAEREVGAATLIVSDLLDYARAREPVTSPVDIADLIEEVTSVIPAPAGITVTTNIAPGLPAAQADRDQLRQVLLNLLTNAYEAMPEGGSISLSATMTDDKVKIVVADTGMGMDEETAARVFEPFFTRKARGIGLGLAVTKRIVDSHHGTIDVASAPAAGTTFTVEIPAAST
jgi:signal transduction histidine kinase